MFERVGVCSWSLRPTSLANLVELVQRTGLPTVQLALEPFRTNPEAWPIRKAVKAFSDAGLTIASTMMTTKGEDYTTIQSIERTAS